MARKIPDKQRTSSDADDGYKVGRGRPPKEHQFRPGVSGNPLGRKPGRSLTDRLIGLLDATEIDGKPIKGGKTLADLVAEALIKHALKGNSTFMKELWERIEGRSPQSIELTGADGEPLGVNLANLETTLLAALDRFPEAKLAVALSLRSLNRGDDGGA